MYNYMYCIYTFSNIYIYIHIFIYIYILNTYISLFNVIYMREGERVYD